MTRSPTVTQAEATDRFDAFTTACTYAGLTVEVVERPRKIKVRDPNGHPDMADVITLHPNTIGTLTWYWSWGAPIAPAGEVDDVVRRVEHVVTSPLPDM